MRYFIYLLLALMVAVGVAFFLQQGLEGHDPGYVLIGVGKWVLETSLYVMGLVAALGFIAFYLIVRLFARVMHLPKHLKQKKSEAGSARSQEALVAGLIDSAEGNWEQAEKSLIRHAANSGAPLMHYLTAAKAAQQRGAYEKRDEYLRLAYESTPGSELAVGLTEAELHLSHNQFDKALDSLRYLESLAPSHAAVLRLLHKTYEKMEDWEAIRKLIPSLHKNKVLMEAELKLLETETYSSLLKQQAEQQDPEALKSIWQTVPGHIKTMPGLHAVYFAAMIEAGAGAEIEQALGDELKKEWNETLVVLYGCIESNDSKAQLSAAEKWLRQHPHDAILLRMLGKLSRRCQLNDKAEQYLSASLELEPSVDGYLFLGDLLAEQGDMERSNANYRTGLLLSSDEVVKQIDGVMEGSDEAADNNSSR